MKATTARYALMGGSIICVYKLIIDIMRHHRESDPYPAFVDHMISLTITSSAIAAFYATRPLHVGLTAFFSCVLVSPFSWYFMKTATIGTNRMNPNIFYQNDCTEEEIERYRHQDQIEEAACQMKLEQGYGLVSRSEQSFI